MNKLIYLALFVPAAMALPGCQSNPAVKPDTVYRQAAQHPATTQPVVKEIKVPVATPQLRRLPLLATKNNKAKKLPGTEETIAEATKKATQGPVPDGFIEAVQTYDYLPGEVYEVYTSPGHITTIALRPGEHLIAKAAGDTARWVIADSHTEASQASTDGALGTSGGTSGGDFRGRGLRGQTLLLVKPLKPNVETNLVISTDQRVYYIDLKSLPGVYQSAVRWNYPQTLAHQLAQSDQDQAHANQMVIARGLDLAQLDFDYRVYAKGEKPNWMPKRVFTDGHKTYIAFPKNLATMQAPPLFVLGRKGQTQLVNYRVKGHYYIVDQVIQRAELRLGENPQRIIRIQRIK